jgi:hypothetical protein
MVERVTVSGEIHSVFKARANMQGVEGFTGQPLIPPNRPTKKIKKLPKYLKKL